MSNITASSTKAQIIESAEELISDLDTKLSTQTQLATTMKEERNSVAYMLIATAALSFFF